MRQQPATDVSASGTPTVHPRDLLAADISRLLRELGIAAVLRHGDPNGARAFKIAGHSFIVETQLARNARKLDLTPRQATIVSLIADGMTNREIADRLGISLHTVRRHVEALLRRLDVPSRAAAAMLLAGTRRGHRTHAN
ncbi:MAG: helix-turn-helix transcriptional regulator [Gemmatimonadaceae bacterium]